MKALLALALALVSLSAHASPFEREWNDLSWKEAAAHLAVQSGGRVKPYDTFAREALELLTGRQTFRGKDSLELSFSFVFEPQVWQETEFLQVTHRPLKKDLGLDETKTYFSPKELMHSVRLMPLFTELQAKQRNQEKLDPYFQAVQRLANQVGFLQELVSGRALRFVPPTKEQLAKSNAWLGFEEYSDELKLRFALMAASFTSADEKVRGRMGEYVQKFRELAAASNPDIYPSERTLAVETHFNRLHPFRWAWILALGAIFVLVLAYYSDKPFWYWGGMGLFGLSFLLQVYGFGLRSWIAGRPPVSNMYESVIWVAFGSMLFGLVLESVYRRRVIALGALIFSALALIIADVTSGVMDDGIHPLEPVLRSNLWLTVHVLTITLGYAAYAISLILGNLGLGQIVLFGKESKSLPLRQLSFYAYRAVQVGVILLAAGTILGGVWADYSWGRFWGWDPKETWALIALLGYLALLHARFRGMVGPFGFLAGSVVAFLGVLMAWYGVNFVLGAGLHSYGFSSGGVSYVATYCTLQLLFVAYAIWMRKRSLAANAS